MTLVNAMIFQQVLSATDERVATVARTVSAPSVADAFLEVWELVLREINYIPIFQLACDIMRELIGMPDLDKALQHLARAAVRVTSQRAALRHDLMGRIYHRLLVDAKFLGACYTTVPAATILLKLALEPDHSPLDWSDIEAIRRLRIADLACGTGTLLKSSLQAVVDNHIRARAERQLAPDLPDVHRVLVEEVIIGLDVVPFAIHLTASALALHEPEVKFNTMTLRTLPLGKSDLQAGDSPIRLGSLELLTDHEISVQADLSGSITGPDRMTHTERVPRAIRVPELDLCVMNPPFTRSVGGNLLFGSVPQPHRRKMQAKLQANLRKTTLGRGVVQANITGGLGTVFAAIGHSLVKPGGHLALVLPRALLSGIAWQPTRILLGKDCHVRYVIVSHEPDRWNFSENTELSECMIVAKRLRRGEKPGPTKVVNLWRQPRTSVEALAVAELIRRTPGVYLDGDTGVDEIATETQKFGEVALCPPERIKTGAWNAEASFAQTELCRAAYRLSRGEVYMPGLGCTGSVALVRLGELGEVGPDCRDIHDGFRLAGSPTQYEALWGHDTTAVQSIAQNANAYLSPLARAKRGRPLRDPMLLWSRAGRLMLAERIRLGKVRAPCVLLRNPALSNTWWPIAVAGEHVVSKQDIERIVALWLNSSLGILSLIAARVETQGPWIKLKKPIVAGLSVPDPASLHPHARQTLLDAYETLSGETLLPIPEMNDDPIRVRIDDALASALGLKQDLAPIRKLMAVEPLIVGARSRAKEE